MSDPLHLALLYGSTREGRFCDTVANWLRAQLALRRDYTVDAIEGISGRAAVEEFVGEHQAGAVEDWLACEEDLHAVLIGRCIRISRRLRM